MFEKISKIEKSPMRFMGQREVGGGGGEREREITNFKEEAETITTNPKDVDRIIK